MKAPEFFVKIAELNTSLANARRIARKLATDPVDGRPFDLNACEELFDTLRAAARLSERINDSVLSD